MINAATKCMPVPDPDLIKSCCHHLLFLIPLQYLYLLPLPTKAGAGEPVPARGGASWLAGGAPARRHLLLIALQHLLLFLTFPDRCGIRFLPKVAFARSLSIPPLSASRSHGAGLVTMLPAFARWLSVIQDVV